ncbi:MAG: hypothetical protein HQK65_15650 [Desulfamplus sp.]|nr:hypothetical protein [Desulfamplus sp.]
MLKEIVVNAAPHETRVAVLENGTIAELFIERGDETNITGNIYKGSGFSDHGARQVPHRLESGRVDMETNCKKDRNYG